MSIKTTGKCEGCNAVIARVDDSPRFCPDCVDRAVALALKSTPSRSTSTR